MSEYYPWRHRESGKLVKIIEQALTTTYEDQDGDRNTLDTWRFNSLYEENKDVIEVPIEPVEDENENENEAPQKPAKRRGLFDKKDH